LHRVNTLTIPKVPGLSSFLRVCIRKVNAHWPFGVVLILLAFCRLSPVGGAAEPWAVCGPSFLPVPACVPFFMVAFSLRQSCKPCTAHQVSLRYQTIIKYEAKRRH
jgi:hypothetical protein